MVAITPVCEYQMPDERDWRPVLVFICFLQLSQLSIFKSMNFRAKILLPRWEFLDLTTDSECRLSLKSGSIWSPVRGSDLQIFFGQIFF